MCYTCLDRVHVILIIGGHKMNKKKTLKKQEFSLNNIPHLQINDEKILTEFKPEKFFQNKKKVAEALLQCLIENDTDTYMEILDSYLRVNRSKIAQNTNLSRSTISLAFSKAGNPTLKTIAKIVHESVRK